MTEALAPTARPERGARIAFAILLLGAAGIAFAPIFVRLSEVGPTATAFWRVCLAVPVLWLWMSVDDRRSDTPARTPESLRD